ncbi:hypothetical protein [Flavimarina sp. Hel_I_48]|uniref:hypothetical protein n=1 Tax=Flavimarina sp. Hel_I_48 TaxID=1392488 RepID=UPI0004DF468F|nr:hypothetical protein [Flavimarina sp. Hel_I_48]
MTESNKMQVLFWRYFFLAIGMVLLCLSILKFYNPDRITDWNNLIIFGGIGLLLMVLNIIFFDKIKSVKVNHNRIIFEENGAQKDVNWKNVGKIGRILFIAPPLYFAVIEKKIIIFPTERNFGYSSFGSSSVFVVIDHSKMGDIIKKAKSQYLI